MTENDTEGEPNIERLGDDDPVRDHPRPRARTPQVRVEDIKIVPLDEDGHRVVVKLMANMIDKYLVANPHLLGEQYNIDD